MGKNKRSRSTSHDHSPKRSRKDLENRIKELETDLRKHSSRSISNCNSRSKSGHNSHSFRSVREHTPKPTDSQYSRRHHNVRSRTAIQGHYHHKCDSRVHIPVSYSSSLSGTGKLMDSEASSSHGSTGGLDLYASDLESVKLPDDSCSIESNKPLSMADPAPIPSAELPGSAFCLSVEMSQFIGIFREKSVDMHFYGTTHVFTK
ncbi:hypothetical protein ABEB36_013575 [Hypothenemus hampei]|uniref:Uncharacterized protein n=1 Tax=Hypothenemus hampei TaxID=57062 RepID=A0ABD1E5K7_HYPHA